MSTSASATYTEVDTQLLQDIKNLLNRQNQILIGSAYDSRYLLDFGRSLVTGLDFGQNYIFAIKSLAVAVPDDSSGFSIPVGYFFILDDSSSVTSVSIGTSMNIKVTGYLSSYEVWQKSYLGETAYYLFPKSLDSTYAVLRPIYSDLDFPESTSLIDREVNESVKSTFVILCVGSGFMLLASMRSRFRFIS